MSGAPLRIPGEWEPHEACWLAFPYLEDEWGDELERAQLSIATLAQTLASEAGERVRLLVRNDAVATRARALIGPLDSLELVAAPYADSWTRDTGPIFGLTTDGRLGAAGFTFNGWGHKYHLPEDSEVALQIARHTEAELIESELVLEGGAVEFDGTGICLTTESCLLNPNRNPDRQRSDIESAIRSSIQVRQFIWLRRGLLHDHTDGHIDMVARFIAPGRVVCMTPAPDDPNADILTEIIQALRASASLEVELIPSPGAVTTKKGDPLPATYCNFYIGNRAVIVPTYGVDADERALNRLRELFPDRRVIGLDGTALLSEGGAFHCVTQPQPAS